MKRTTIQLALSIFLLSITIENAQAQAFTGLSAFKTLIKYEGQRYLMEEVYQIKSEDYDKLKIVKTIEETDASEGFLFVLTSYKFNDKRGAIITSFNSTSLSNDQYGFVNIHLGHNEYLDLYNTFKHLEKMSPEDDEHFLRKFNDRLIVDVNNQAEVLYFTLWVDYHNRHTFTTTKWDRAFKKYQKFVEQE